MLLRDLGAAISPFNAFQIIQGIETLPLRIVRHCRKRRSRGRIPASRNDVAKVIHPASSTGIEKERAEKYLPRGQRRPGRLRTRRRRAKQAKNFIYALKLFYHVANIGDARSLAIHPASTTHSQLSPEEQTASGVTPGYVRLSVGLEHIDDIIEDLTQALDAV